MRSFAIADGPTVTIADPLYHLRNDSGGSVTSNWSGQLAVGGGTFEARDGSTSGNPVLLPGGAVLRAVEGTRSTFQASATPDLADLWLEISEAVSKVVDRVTFEDLVARARERRGRARPMYHI